MNIAKDYITSCVDCIAREFEQIEISSFYNRSSDTFFIKISPIYIYESSKFSVIESKIIEGFYRNDFEENICIISDDTPMIVEDAKEYSKIIKTPQIDSQSKSYRKELELGINIREEVTLKTINDYSFAA